MNPLGMAEFYISEIVRTGLPLNCCCCRKSSVSVTAQTCLPRLFGQFREGVCVC